MSSIQATRQEISDRFSVLGFNVRTNGRRWFEVALATDPELFRKKDKRSAQNFFSSRVHGPLLAERGESVYLVPPDVLRRFTGQTRVYYGLATFADSNYTDPSVLQIPGAENPWVSIKAFTGKVPRRMLTLRTSGRAPGGGDDYGVADPSELTWAGDSAQPGIEAAAGGNGHGKGNGNGTATAPGKTNGSPEGASAGFAYDDGFGPLPFEAPTDESETGIEGPIPDEAELTSAAQRFSRPLQQAAEYPQAAEFIPARFFRTPKNPRTINRIVIHITDGVTGDSRGTARYFQNPGRWLRVDAENGQPQMETDAKGVCQRFKYRGNWKNCFGGRTRTRNGHTEAMGIVEVSAHYGVGQDGTVVQMVKHADVAFHASSANGDSIGIEHNANARNLPPSEAQYCASAKLVRWLAEQFSVPLDRQHILGHSEADPKTSHTDCPNSVWDWDYFMGLIKSASCYPRAAASQGLQRGFALAAEDPSAKAERFGKGTVDSVDAARKEGASDAELNAFLDELSAGARGLSIEALCRSHVLEGRALGEEGIRIRLPGATTLSGWKARVALSAIGAAFGGVGGAALFNLLPGVANGLNVTIGLGPSVSGGVGGGGAGLGVGIVFAPNDTIGFYGSLSGAIGAIESISATVQVTIVRGGPSNFNGEAIAVTVAGGEGLVGSGSVLLSTSGGFLGISAEIGIGAGIPVEFYGQMQKTYSTAHAAESPVAGALALSRIPGDGVERLKTEFVSNAQAGSPKSCIVITNAALRKMYGSALRDEQGNDRKLGTTIHDTMGALQGYSLAQAPVITEYNDASGRLTRGVARPAALQASIEGWMKAEAEKEGRSGWYLFGLSIADGYHSVILGLAFSGASSPDTHVYWADQIYSGWDDVTGQLDQRITQLTQKWWDPLPADKKFRTRVTIWALLPPPAGTTLGFARARDLATEEDQDGVEGAEEESVVIGQSLGGAECSDGFCPSNSAASASTDHFTVEEFRCRDGTAVPEKFHGNVQEVMNNLEVLRTELGGKAIQITSGYRTCAYNSTLEGAASRSRHLCGQAADIKVTDHTPQQVHEVIERLIGEGRMKQGGLGLYKTFVHYDVRGTRQRWGGSTASTSSALTVMRSVPFSRPTRSNPGSTAASALTEAGAFVRSATKGAFKLPHADVAARLTALIIDPDLVEQATLNLCGPAAFFNILLRRDPVTFARYAAALYRTGEGMIGGLSVEPGSDLKNQTYRASWGCPTTDWMTMSAIRDSENAVLDFEGTPEEDVAGATTPAEMADWLAATGLYSSVSDEGNWVLTRGISHAKALKPASNNDIALLINAHILGAAAASKKKSDDFITSAFPNHFVVLKTPIVERSGKIEFRCWCWGAIYSVSVNRATFDSNYYGAVTATV